MKKVLFLYPLREYMQILHDNETIELMKATIDKRYRQKGYEINYLVFPDKNIIELDAYEQDKIIETDITFEAHTTPIQQDKEGNSIYKYPDNMYIQAQLGELDELVVCGFHADDCVRKTADFFTNQSIDVLVDLELTDFFRIYKQFPTFQKEKYNFANLLQNLKAQDQFYGFSKRLKERKIEDLFQESYYQKNNFKPTISIAKLVTEMEKQENKFKK